MGNRAFHIVYLLLFCYCLIVIVCDKGGRTHMLHWICTHTPLHPPCVMLPSTPTPTPTPHHTSSGRSWLDAPRDIRPDNDNCYAPKRWLHTWSGHTKGVNQIEFFPNTGHLLLSAGLDGKVKIWNVHGTYKCMRTYMGHTKVRVCRGRRRRRRVGWVCLCGGGGGGEDCFW